MFPNVQPDSHLVQLCAITSPDTNDQNRAQYLPPLLSLLRER